MNQTMTPVDQVQDRPSDQLQAVVESDQLDTKLDQPTKPAAVVAPAEVEREIPFGPILIRSVTNATLAFFVITGVAQWVISGRIWDGVGLGAFCAFWGGPGFGLMAAGAKWTYLQERMAAAHH